jgi:hypothetical protein
VRHRGHKGRVDGNQKAIMDALRKVGCKVRSTAEIGEGFPDLLVRPPGRMASLIQMETKMPKGKLEPDQVKYLTEFPETLIVRSVEDALRAVGVKI